MTLDSSDFLREPRQPATGWFLLCVGAAAIASALWLDAQWAAQQQHVLAADRAIAEVQRVAAAQIPPPELTLAQRRWVQIEPELNRPWLPTLRAIEAATVNPVFLLSLTIEPSPGLVKLDAEAPSFDHAMAYVQVLDESKALQPATMLSHDLGTDAGNSRGVVRFSATTVWVAP